MSSSPRFPFPSSQSGPQGPSFGLISWLEATRIVLPLKGLEARFVVTGDVAEISLEQIFIQNRATPLDVTYTFPLPARASVFRCEMVVNGRVVAAQAMTEQKAAEVFATAKRDGRRAMLVAQERNNLFTLQLGNLQPGEVVVIRLAYVQELDRLHRTVALRIPFAPGVRYIPGKSLLRSNRGDGTVDDTDEVPDASRITPPRIDALHPDAAQVRIIGRFDRADLVLESLVSPTHGVAIRERDSTVNVSLLDSAEVPDRDFVLRWEEPRVEKSPDPRVESAFSVGTVTPDWFHLLRLISPEERSVREPAEVWVILDRSGSMEGVKWKKCCEALIGLVNRLEHTDSFALTLFNDAYLDFSEDLMPVETVRRDPRFASLVSLGTAGGTDLLPALTHVIDRWPTAKTLGNRHLIVITDGQVGNEQALVEVASQLVDTQIHCFGIDNNVNDSLLEKLARHSGGRCVMLTPQDDLKDAMDALAGRLKPPVLDELTLAEGFEAAGNAATRAFAGETTTWFAKGPPERTPTVYGNGRNGHAVALTASQHLTPSRGPELLWVKFTAERLLKADELQRALTLAAQYNLLIDGLSYIAVDLSSLVPIAQKDFYQPQMNPQFCRSATVAYFSEPQSPFEKGPVFSDAELTAPLVKLKNDRHVVALEPRQPTAADAGTQVERKSIELSGRLPVWVWIKVFDKLRDILDVAHVGTVGCPADSSVIRALMAWAEALGTLRAAKTKCGLISELAGVGVKSDAQTGFVEMLEQLAVSASRTA